MPEFRELNVTVSRVNPTYGDKRGRDERASKPSGKCSTCGFRFPSIEPFQAITVIVQGVFSEARVDDMTISLCLTIDHDLIKSWARRRAARPSRPLDEDRPWPLLFELGAPAAGVVEIGWDEFFEEFERANLVFSYREAAPDGTPDDTHEFVKRAAVPALITSGRSTIVERVV